MNHRPTCHVLLVLGLTAPLFGQITTDVRTATVVVAAQDTMVAAGPNARGWDYQVPAAGDAAVTIKTAIDAMMTLTAGRGGRVVLLEGTYDLKTTLTLTNPASAATVPNYCNIIIEGQSTGAIVGSNNQSKPHGTRLEYGTNGAFAFAGYWSAGVPANRMVGITLRNLHFAPSSTNDALVGTAVKLSQTNDACIEGCYFEKCSPAIFNEASWDVHVSRCNFDSCGSRSSTATSAVVLDLGPLVSTSTYPGEDTGMSGCYFLDCVWAMKPGIAIFVEGIATRRLADNLQIIGCKFEGYDGGNIHWAAPSIVGHMNDSRIMGSQFFGAVASGGASQEGSHIFIESATNVVSNRNIVTGNHFTDYTGPAVSVSGHRHMVTSNQFVFYEGRHGMTTRTKPHIEVRDGGYLNTVLGNTYGGESIDPTSGSFVANVKTAASASHTHVIDLGGFAAVRYAQQNYGNDGAAFSVSQSQWNGTSHAGIAPEGLYSDWWYTPNGSTWENNGFNVLGTGVPSFKTVTGGTGTPTVTSAPVKWLSVKLNGTSYYLPLYQ